MPECPLCGGAAKPLLEDSKRRWRYALCQGPCALAFRCDELKPGPRESRARYGTHQNTPSPGYEKFLEPAAAAIAARCASGSEGLDYGCGPGPVLALMLGERGMRVALHDPHFAPEPLTLSRRYDFVVCTEAAEHFERPREDFDRLAAALKPGGWLALMTSPRDPEASFDAWHYRLDPTHLIFFCETTLSWLAAARQWRLERVTPALSLFQAP